MAASCSAQDIQRFELPWPSIVLCLQIRSVVSLGVADSEVPPPAHVTQSAVKGFELLHSAFLVTGQNVCRFALLRSKSGLTVKRKK